MNVFCLNQNALLLYNNKNLFLKHNVYVHKQYLEQTKTNMLKWVNLCFLSFK